MKHRIKLLPLPYYGPDDGKGQEPEKTPAQIERDNIKVTGGEQKEEEKEIEGEEDNNEEGDDKEADEEKGEDDKEEDDDTEKEPKELTEEQKQIQALKKKLERAQRRAGKTASERDENRKKVKELEAALAAKLEEGTQPLTEEEVNRRARELANQDLTVREFNAAQDKLIADATAIDKNFMSKINELAQDVAPLPEFFIGALNDLDNGGEVLNFLTDNPDDYENLLKKPNPMRIMKGLVDISNKLLEAKKPKPKKVSNAPEPAGKLKGSTKSPDQMPIDPTKDMEGYIRVRAAQDKARREARGD